MKDTEPMEIVRPPNPPEKATVRARARSYRAPILIALSLVAIAYVGWSNYEFSMMRGEIRQARAAAETASRNAREATLAAEATQTTIAAERQYDAPSIDPVPVDPPVAQDPPEPTDAPDPTEAPEPDR